MAPAISPEEAEQLRDEVERLRSDNAKLARRVAWRAALRRTAMVFLLVLGCGLAAASAVAIWARVTVLNTDNYVQTMAPIAESPAVQNAVADKIDTAVTSQVDFDALARQVLPDRADLLAPAIANGVQSVIRSRVEDFVHSDRFPALWNAANRRVHESVVGLLTTGQSKRLELEGNTVYLDLGAVVDRVRERLRERGLTRVANAIPASVDGRVALLSSDAFAQGQGAIDRLERWSIGLPILSLLALAGYVWLCDSRRRGLLRVGLGLALTGLLLLTVVVIGRSLYLDAIDQQVLPRQAAADIFDALIGSLRGALRIAVLCALVLAAFSLLSRQRLQAATAKAGPQLQAASARISTDPRTSWVAEHRAGAQWGVIIFGGLVLVAWDNPTAGVVLVDVALIAVAVWVLAALAHSARRPAS
jgi:hypothetical protein